MNKVLLLIILNSLINLACSSSKVALSNKTVAPFDGKKFHNLEPLVHKGLWDVVKWQFQGLSVSKKWPEFKETKQFKVKNVRSENLVITVINHASVLIQIDNVNILTDPHYSMRASPVQFLGPKRSVSPGIAFDDLPPIDVVLISHNHYDHLDLETLKRLNDKFSPKFYAGLGTKKFLEENQIKNCFDLDWWQSFLTKKIKITFVPAQHWSARGIFDKREMLWGGFYIEATKSVYFAGDTAYGSFFKLIEKKLSPPDVALLPIGAYLPRWFMKYAHMNPKESVQASIDLKASSSIGIHFGTFKLTDEAIDDPAKDLLKALDEKKINKAKFIVPVFGQAINY